ncbi:hypothetical protein C0995_002715 [Termitomyces sp. Mi166|nr:hypothetical protein C0995_002715 [Termitomyces sp. Mi166\
MHLRMMQDKTFQAKEQAEEARFIREKEQAQLAAIRNDLDMKSSNENQAQSSDRNFEGGFGGQEDLEDRYATTSGEH